MMPELIKNENHSVPRRAVSVNASPNPSNADANALTPKSHPKAIPSSSLISPDTSIQLNQSPNFADNDFDRSPSPSSSSRDLLREIYQAEREDSSRYILVTLDNKNYFALNLENTLSSTSQSLSRTLLNGCSIDDVSNYNIYITCFSNPKCIGQALKEHELQTVLREVSRSRHTAKLFICKEDKVLSQQTPDQESNIFADAPKLNANEASSAFWADAKDSKVLTEPEKLTRKTSFAYHTRHQAWVQRPEIDVLYENLEDFFPNHDLDKPIVEESEIMPDIRVEVKKDTRQENRQETNDQRNLRKRSIRHIADRAHRLQQTLSVQSNNNNNNNNNKFQNNPITTNINANNLIRRKSTKIWDSRIIEMKPWQVKHDSEYEQDSQEELTFRWLKGELIGKGTFGRVYIGLNVNTGELIAVKQLDILKGSPFSNIKDSNSAKDTADLFFDEVQMMKELDHPNIVQYLGYEMSDATLSIFLEYIPGGSIGSFLHKYGKMNEDLIRYFTRQILYGLAYLHSKGILHRDMKSDNLLIDQQGNVKITDFGLSKRVADAYFNEVNLSMKGTIFWMAPEVVQNKKRGYSAKIDIWSLGCVVLEMFAGCRPWGNEEALGALFKLGTMKSAPPIPDYVKKEASSEAVDFMESCFELDPDIRPTAENLIEHMFCKKPDSEKKSLRCKSGV